MDFIRGLLICMLYARLACAVGENLEVFGRGELVVRGIAFNDVDVFAEVLEDAGLVGGREV